MIRANQLSYVAGAYLSGRGYYCELSPEVPDAVHRPDVLAVKPRAKDVKLRMEKGAAPVGIIYPLLENEWLSTADLIEQTGFEPAMARGILEEALESGWVRRRVEQDGSRSWAIDRYRVPASECLMAMCAAEKPKMALEALDGLAGCCDRMCLAFPYRVEPRFLEECARHNAGVMVFDEGTCSFIVQLPAKRQEITRFKAYASICERAVISHNIRLP
jgi:hypothetical protein